MNGEATLTNKCTDGVRIGWYFPITSLRKIENKKRVDRSIADLCKKFGNLGYSFICFPVGGLEREETNPPQIHLPDVQMPSHLWRGYVSCCVSQWLDPDSNILWLADISRKELKKEIEYGVYLGVSVIIIELKHRNSPELSNILLSYAKTEGIHFLIVIPTSINKLSNSSENKDDEDIWSIWANFRLFCGNDLSLLSIALKFTEDVDEDFLLTDLLNRWHSEPLKSVFIDATNFVNDENHMELSSFNKNLLSYLISSPEKRIILSSSSLLNSEKETLNIAKTMLDAIHRVNFEKLHNYDEYCNVLQNQLQPLSSNLSSVVYQTFEEDRTKYDAYQLAIGVAMSDLVNQLSLDTVTIFVLGAGRGPLVESSYKAFRRLKESKFPELKFRIVAVEKNTNACRTLEYYNETKWRNSVLILECDMRSKRVREEIKNLGSGPDIIVSELLGSFGDNELSPECLDGVVDLFQSHTISIPQSYRNFIVPIQSVILHQTLLSTSHHPTDTSLTQGRNNSVEYSTDSLYVTKLYNYCMLSSDPRQCFEFKHPNTEGNTNARSAVLEFPIDVAPSELHGFAGFFEVTLYRNITLNTLPKKHTINLHGWFPALFPLRDSVRIKQSSSSSVILNIARKCDKGGVWYEWFSEIKNGDTFTVTPLQNENGHSLYMKIDTE